MKDITDSKNYTLEKHLRLLSEEDKDYELLYSIWDLNKKNLSQGLNLTCNLYPHYSLHDITHSMTIINNIQCLLGESRIKNLGATDTFLLLMACLTHDIGMILTYKIIEEEWEKETFRELIEKLSNNDDSVIADAAKLLLRNNKDNGYDDSNFKWALEVKNAVVILTAEIFRNKHAKQSADYLLSNKEFKHLADNFYSEQLPNRFIELLANVALLHGEYFDKVMSSLYSKANGYKGDYIHPRFIACMIRLGDLLDFDSNRFNIFSIATIKEIPNVSVMHHQKHASVRHMLISPTTIEAELDCHNENVYRIARKWFDWLEEEVDNQSREWSNIAPNDLGGLPPIISKDSIKILYKGIHSSPDLLNLRFYMSQKKMFSILQGGGIYKEPGFAFIREIVQNAFDASKIQMWNDITSGIYDSYFEDNSKDVNSILFSDDIPSSIYRQYPINLSINWLNDKKDTILIECTDRGTGISESALLRMTKFVGESHKMDEGYTERYQKMPYWLKPTAAFGIGLQSIFFVSSTFEVETSFPGEKSKRIIFRSAADNQYCSIIEENINIKRGTIIKVDIKREKCSELFGNTFSWDILDNVNVFQGDGDDLYLAKIDKFVVDTLGSVNNVNFNYITINKERCFKRIVPDECSFDSVVEGNYKYSCEFVNEYLVFKVCEKEYGSSFVFWFNNEIKRLNAQHRLLLRDVWVSNAKLNYFKTSYMDFEWNLCNQTTDKIVDLSRDNLTYQGNELVTKTLLYELLPKCISLVNNMFADKLVDCAYKESLSYQYFNYCLTSLSCHINTYNSSILSNIKLPLNMVSCNKMEITADKLFNAQSIFLIKGLRETRDIDVLQKEHDSIELSHSKLLKDKIVIWGDNYLRNALMYNYICVDIIVYESNCKIYKLERIDKAADPYHLVVNDEKYLYTLEMVSFHTCSRSSIYGLTKYPQIVVKNYRISGFEEFPDYSFCSIFSPFNDREQIKKMLNDVKGKQSLEVKNYVLANISEYITPYMLNIVKQHNIKSDITDEEIKEGYLSLIYDYILLKKNDSEETVD